MARLLFGNDCVKFQAGDNNISFKDRFVRFIDRVLLHHQGSVHKFSVRCVDELCSSDINQWTLFASRNNVRELSLRFGCNVITPSSLFQCSKLTYLHLISCKIRELPVGFDGFMSLKALIFNRVEIPKSSLEKLISGCPILESLEFLNCRLEVFRVHAPLLKCLRLLGDVDEFFLEKTPLLKELAVRINGHPDDARNGAVIKFLDRVPSLEKLVANSFFMKRWSQGDVPTTSAITHDHLRSILLDVNFEDPIVVLHLLKLMDHSPILENICVVSFGRRTPSEVALGSEFWCKARDGGCKFLRLKKARITARDFTEEMEFVKFLLLNSPALEKMLVDLRYIPVDVKNKMVAELLRCRRVSKEAGVVCLGF